MTEGGPAGSRGQTQAATAWDGECCLPSAQAHEIRRGRIQACHREQAGHPTGGSPQLSLNRPGASPVQGRNPCTGQISGRPWALTVRQTGVVTRSQHHRAMGAAGVAIVAAADVARELRLARIAQRSHVTIDLTCESGAPRPTPADPGLMGRGACADPPFGGAQPVAGCGLLPLASRLRSATIRPRVRS